jgi:hypothetical protein
MKKKWVVIILFDLALLVSVVMLSLHVRDLIGKFKFDHKPERIPVRTDGRVPQDKGLPPLAPPNNYIPTAFSIIPEKTIFSENRTNKVEAEPAAPAPVIPPMAQKPILVGTSISDSQQRALIFDPTAPPDKARRAKTMRVGDVYQGYTITHITAENIVLEAGSQKEIIPLHEGSKKGKAGKTAIQATRIVGIGQGGAAGGGAVPGGGSAKPNPAQAAANAPNAPGGPQNAAVAAQPPQPQQPPQPRSNTTFLPDGRRQIVMPFGTVTR